jgi:hypothetical protein
MSALPPKADIEVDLKIRPKKYRQFKVRLMGPGGIPHRKFNDLNCQTALTAAMGAKGNLLDCKTGNRNARR